MHDAEGRAGAIARLAAHAGPVITAALLCLALAISPPPAYTLRVVTWNLFVYPDDNLAARQPHFRTVMANIAADVRSCRS